MRSLLYPHNSRKGKRFSSAKGARILPTENGLADGKHLIADVHKLRASHEVALRLSDMIVYDGGGSWPPKCAHHVPSQQGPSPWPEILQPYSEIYLEMVPMLASLTPSLDDDENRARILMFRAKMALALQTRVDVDAVVTLLKDVESGKWGLLPGETVNGFYCCLAVLRHAYRWSTIPIVKVAQRERIVTLPSELDRPWAYLQRHFGVEDDTASGNNTANVLHNFGADGKRVYRINVLLPDEIQSAEETFFQIFYDVEEIGLPIYHCLVAAIIFFDAGELVLCHNVMVSLTGYIADLTRLFYKTLNDEKIPRRFWMSYVQGFQGWGAGRYVHQDGTDVHSTVVAREPPSSLYTTVFRDGETRPTNGMRGCPMANMFASDSPELTSESESASAAAAPASSDKFYDDLDNDPTVKFIRYDGLSGNHVLVFQAIDAFLGLPIYLSDENMRRYVPRRQREFCDALRRHNFRAQLKGSVRIGNDTVRMHALIHEEIDKILKHLRLFRAAHRTRVLPYLYQPAPERVPMTAGKSMLTGATIEDALQPLDDLMAGRLNVTV